MSKKNWIMVKRGLSEDPKHREAMGNRIWLYLHIIDRADWETGIVYDWRDGNEAEDMGLNHRTLERQRQELADLDYIECKQRKNGQDIAIKNWINPRNYSGGMINKKGTQIFVPQEYKGTHKGTHKGSNELRTPSLGSLDHSSGNQDGADKPRPRDELFDAITEACAVDPATAGASVGKVKTALLKVSPPYTADEVRAWRATWPAWKDKAPTLWQLKEQIGAIRAPLMDRPAGDGRSAWMRGLARAVAEANENGDAQ